MSGYDRRYKCVLSLVQKVGNVGDDVTSSGRPFHVCEAATSNITLPTVDSLNDDTTRRSVLAERIQRRAGKSDTRTSGFTYRGAVPRRTLYIVHPQWSLSVIFRSSLALQVNTNCLKTFVCNIEITSIKSSSDVQSNGVQICLLVTTRSRPL